MHSVTKVSPFKALFGREPNGALNNISLPKWDSDKHNGHMTEEDLALRNVLTLVKKISSRFFNSYTIQLNRKM